MDEHTVQSARQQVLKSAGVVVPQRESGAFQERLGAQLADRKIRATSFLTELRAGPDAVWDAGHSEAGSAEEAIRLLEREELHVIPFEYDLPGMDGIVALKEIRKRGIERPVVAITGEGSEEVARQFLAAGATDYLTKSDFSPLRLGQTIKNAVWLTSLRTGYKSNLVSKLWKDA